MIRSLIQRIYPFASASSAHFDNFVWIVWLLVLGIYVVAGGSIIWTPVCYWLLGRTLLEAVCDRMERKLGWCVLAGAGTIAVVYAFDSALSLVATPGRVFGFVISTLFWVMLVVGYAAAALWVIRIARRRSDTLFSATVGALLILILQLIPMVGTLFLAWFVLVALGSVIVTLLTMDWSALRATATADSAAPQPPASDGP